MKRIILIILLAFLLNLIWENLHVFLYSNYMGGEITKFILLRATLVDAIIITIITMPFVLSRRLKRNSWLIILIGFAISIGIEFWALETGRWAYNELMPIIPYMSIGLTPAIQLGILGFVAYKISASFDNSRV
jgi:hypothetical protein